MSSVLHVINNTRPYLEATRPNKLFFIRLMPDSKTINMHVNAVCTLFFLEQVVSEVRSHTYRHSVRNFRASDEDVVRAGRHLNFRNASEISGKSHVTTCHLRFLHSHRCTVVLFFFLQVAQVWGRSSAQHGSTELPPLKAPN